MATKNPVTSSVTQQTPTELEQYRVLKQKLQREGNERAAQAIAQIKTLFRELQELRNDFDIIVDFESLVYTIDIAGINWNASSQNC